VASETKDIRNLLLLISLVERNPGIKISRVAELMGCFERSAEEYLNRVLMCGVPPYLPDNYIGFIRRGDAVTLTFASHMGAPVRLSLREGLSLRLLLETLPHQADSPYLKPVKNLVSKIERAMSPVSARVRGANIAAADRTRFAGEKFDRILAAIRDGKKIVMEYYSVSRGEMTKRKVAPYTIVEHSGDWYLAGDCHLRRRELMFRIDRIKSVETTGESCAPPRRFNPAKYRRRSIYRPESEHIRCEISFPPWVVRRVKEALHAKVVKTLPDGRVVLSLAASGRPWLFRFLLKFAPDAELLMPAPLRAEFRGTLKELLKLYDKS